MTNHTLLVLCIPVALAAGLLWGIAWEKHRASHRREHEKMLDDEKRYYTPKAAAQCRHVEAVAQRAQRDAERQTDDERSIRSRPF